MITTSWSWKTIPDVRYSLRKELSANFQVEVAGNGNEALDLLGQG